MEFISNGSAIEHFTKVVADGPEHQSLDSHRALGHTIGCSVRSAIPDRSHVLLVGPRDDMDGFIQGVYDALIEADHNVQIGCFWMKRTSEFRDREIRISQVHNEYVEDLPATVPVLIYAALLMPDACDLTSAIHRLLHRTQFAQLHVVAPVVPTRLAGPVEIPFHEGENLTVHSLLRGRDFSSVPGGTSTGRKWVDLELQRDNSPRRIPGLVRKRMEQDPVMTRRPSDGPRPG